MSSSRKGTWRETLTECGYCVCGVLFVVGLFLFAKSHADGMVAENKVIVARHIAQQTAHDEAIVQRVLKIIDERKQQLSDTC
jgi:hypothetical protein